jgi:hypothetical protein
LKCLSCCQRRLQIATRPMATSRCDAPPAGKEGHVQKFPEARDSGELTVRPRSPAARNAFRNQISSLVKSKPTLAHPYANRRQHRHPASIMPFSSLASFTDRSACASLRILLGRSRRGQDAD